MQLEEAKDVRPWQSLNTGHQYDAVAVESDNQDRVGEMEGEP